MTGKVMETVVKLMGSIDPSLAKSISTAQSSFKKMGKTAAVAGKALGGIAAVGATAEDRGMFGLALLFTVLPETVVIFGLVIALLIMFI